MIKIVASDLDGTLIPPHLSRPTQKSLELIHELSLNGVHFISASGRQYKSQKNIFGDDLSNEISFISESGAICIHKDKIIQNIPLPYKTAQNIIERLSKDNKYDIVISCLDTCFIENKNPDFISLINSSLKNSFETIDDFKKINEPVYKIALYDKYKNPEEFIKYMKDFRTEFDNEIKIVTSDASWIDFIHKDVSKGSALEKFLELLNVSKDECVVFGDEYNDIEMLKMIPNSFAMTTCAKGVEKYASFRAKNIEEILEKILKTLK